MFQIIPSIDLRGGKVVRLQQGDYARQLDYDLNPIEVAKSFEDAGAQWMHIVDLDGAKSGAVTQIALIQKIIESCKLKVQVGGGVRSSSDVKCLISAGARRVVIGTKAIEDWQWFETLAKEEQFKNQIVLALDAKDGFVATHAWTSTGELRAIDVAKKVRGWPLAGILYTDVAKDGMLAGPNYETTLSLANATDVPVIASGGIGNVEQIENLSRLPLWGVIVGRSLHEGRLDLRDAFHRIKIASPKS